MKEQINYRFKIFWLNLINWFYFKKNMFLLFWADAPKEQRWLEIGNYYLRKGAKVKVGQPIKVPVGNGKMKQMFIKNLYFNFDTNKVTANYTVKPIKGKSDPFIKTKNELKAIKLKALLNEKK